MILPSNQQVKQSNLDKTRMRLRSCATATKAQLAKDCGLSVVTMGTLIAELVERGEALEGAILPSAGGRPARTYQFNANYAHALTLFILQKNSVYRLHTAVIDLMGRVIRTENAPLGADASNALLDTAMRYCREDQRISAIAIGIPGQAVDGKVLFCDIPEMVNVHLQTQIEKRTRCAVVVENDMNATVYGYAQRKSPNEDACTVAVYFPIGKPPGAGILLGSRLLRGKDGMSGELCHLPMPVDWENPAQPIERIICDYLRAVTAVLAPERMIVYREGLRYELLRQWINQTWSCVPARPEIVTTETPALDYELGVRQLALARLLPQNNNK